MPKKTQIKTKIALLGFGLDNQALLSLILKTKDIPDITICDYRDKNLLTKVDNKKLKINYRLGKNFNKGLGDFDILFRSPGWPIACPGIQEAVKSGSYLSSALEIFFKTCPTKNIVGVTGTKGKGTSATLIYKIIKAWLKEKNKNKTNKIKVFLGGNIGLSPISFLHKIKEQDFVVLELSSFQLEDLKQSTKISVITNLYQEHLSPADPNNPNFHSSLNDYWQAKLNIAKHSENKILIAAESLKNRLKNLEKEKNIKYFGTSNLVSAMEGEYNKKNIAAAVELAKYLRIKKDIYSQVIKNFKNLEHRLEPVTGKAGISFFNNSFSTTPESTELDLLSFNKNIIQIAGGADKGANFKNLAKTIKKKVKFLILFPGKGSDKIKIELKKINFPHHKLAQAKNMKEAVNLALKQSEAGDVILLSTACASFGLFKNYKERGLLFKQAVKESIK